MRKLLRHVVEGDSANHQLDIGVLDEAGSGGASHFYVIAGFDTDTNPSRPAWPASIDMLAVLFQNGPIKEVGVNGVTHEALLVILIDRLEGFQDGPFASSDNAEALYHLNLALRALQRRTKARIARRVEGTHQP
jgi:hypothetical protein